MIASVVFCVLVAGAFGAVHDHPCAHSNHQALTEDMVIEMVLADMDKDNDGHVTVAEVTQEFVTDYGNGNVTEDEFVKTWHTKYHDVQGFAGYLFHHFDTDGNEMLDAADVIALEKKIDADGDGTVSNEEFRKFMANLYTKCVPIHGHHVHTGHA